MGTIQFLGFTIGALLFTHLADVYGRRMVVIISSLVTPIGITLLTIYPQTLESIYFTTFMMGLSFATRSSVTYIMALEFLPSKYHMYFGIAQFSFDGISTMFVSFIMQTFRSQTLYLNMISFSVFWFSLLVLCYIPESPKFLLSKKKFD